MDDLVGREDLFYEKFNDIPFTGEVDEGLIKGSIQDGKKEGYWIGYHENGQLWAKGDYKNGLKDGAWVFYHESGRLHARGNYKNGKKDGWWQVYTDSNVRGTIDEKWHGNWIDGVEVSE
jgi:antitoxin component YwqK of YwqJK toxin-antitoxin module